MTIFDKTEQISRLVQKHGVGNQTIDFIFLRWVNVAFVYVQDILVADVG